MLTLLRTTLGVIAAACIASASIASPGGSLPLRVVVNEVEQTDAQNAPASGLRQAMANPERLKAAIAAQERHTDALLQEAGARGTAVSWDQNSNPVIKVYVDEASSVTAIPSTLDGIPVQVEFSGRVYALNVECESRDDQCGESQPAANAQIDSLLAPPSATEPGPTEYHPRPVPIGVSTGHIDITAGTLGCRVSAGCHTYALSNAHVYANENEGAVGDSIVQPGIFDGGINPEDTVGTLADAVPIDMSETAFNRVDAAIALVSGATVGTATPPAGYGQPRIDTMPAVVGLNVKKFGRTTWQTYGYVDAINGVVLVAYNAGDARFVGQIIIKPDSGDFSRPGDSGSLVVADGGPDDRRPVGLLFASGTDIAVANPIDDVLDELGVVIDGE